MPVTAGENCGSPPVEGTRALEGWTGFSRACTGAYTNSDVLGWAIVERYLSAGSNPLKGNPFGMRLNQGSWWHRWRGEMRSKAADVEVRADHDADLRLKVWDEWGDALHTAMYWKAKAARRNRLDRNLRGTIALVTCGSSASICFRLGWDGAWAAITFATSLLLTGLTLFNPTESIQRMAAVGGQWSRLANQLSALFGDLPNLTPQTARERLDALMVKVEKANDSESGLPANDRSLQKRISQEVKKTMERRIRNG
jgi:hypothetical protein